MLQQFGLYCCCHYFSNLLLCPRYGRRSIVMTVSVCLPACLPACLSVCLPVCLSVCQLAYLWNYTSNLHQFLPNFYACYLCPLLSPPLHGVAIRYILPVLWVASYLHIMGHMQGCQCNTGTASQPDGAARWLGLARPWLKQQAVSL